VNQQAPKFLQYVRIFDRITGQRLGALGRHGKV
jgi:hypothetical protein